MALLSEIAPVAAILDRPHGLLEGPRLGADGEVVYSDVIGGGLWSCSPEGVVRELLPKRRGIGGIVAHADGGWVVSGRTLLHLSPDGAQRELLGGDEVCGFNDLGVTATGELLAGALRYRPLAGESPRHGQLLRIGPGGATDVITEEVIWPNGVGLAPGGKRIYLSDYARQMVLALSPDGQSIEEFCRSPSGSADGLAVDADGGVWVALGEGAAVARFDAGGELDEVIAMPTRFVSSISFGGPDRRDVLVSTADNQVDPQLGGTVLRARSEVAGVPLASVTV